MLSGVAGSSRAGDFIFAFAVLRGFVLGFFAPRARVLDVVVLDGFAFEAGLPTDLARRFAAAWGFALALASADVFVITVGAVTRTPVN